MDDELRTAFNVIAAAEKKFDDAKKELNDAMVAFVNLAITKAKPTA